MTDATPASDSGQKAWYCVRTQPKHEHIAAAHLAELKELEIYLPRIRFRRSTKAGPVWFTEALFPGYLFARFSLYAWLRQVQHTTGVSGVVHFGTHWPVIPDEAVADLQAGLGPDQLHILPEELQPGEPVVISGGAFHNLRAVVSRVMPGRQRVAVLLEFLGRQTTVEVDPSQLVPEGDARSRWQSGR
jgi:transcriptional antiterminator RfaH